MLYEWPGNIRELENAIERAVVVSKSRKILPEDLPIFQPAKPQISQHHSLHIKQILNTNNWNISKSAEILCIDRSTLYNKIKRYNIQKSD